MAWEGSAGVDKRLDGFIFKAGAAKGRPQIRPAPAGSVSTLAAEKGLPGFPGGSFVTTLLMEVSMDGPTKRKDPDEDKRSTT